MEGEWNKKLCRWLDWGNGGVKEEIGTIFVVQVKDQIGFEKEVEADYGGGVRAQSYGHV